MLVHLSNAFIIDFEHLPYGLRLKIQQVKYITKINSEPSSKKTMLFTCKHFLEDNDKNSN